MTALAELEQYAAELRDLNAILAVLDWDQQTFMPRGGAAGRAAQAATLAKLAQEKLLSPDYERLLIAAERANPAPEGRTAALLTRLRRDYEKDRLVPAELAGKIAETIYREESAWEQAKAADDFSLAAPGLEKLLELKREYAALFPGFATLYDALLDDYEPGATTAMLDAAFAPLRDEAPGLIDQITATMPERAPEFTSAFCAHDAQLEVCRKIVTELGYDWNHGRLDEVEHPFTTDFGLGDVRITTHIFTGNLLSGIFSCVHECGHALYQQAIAPELDRTPLADGASLGFHESQSRFWENVVARSPEFWHHFLPELRRAFPDVYGNVSVEEITAAVMRVERSKIRTEADEVTYNQHILLRYDLEKQLISGRLAVRDLPDAWRAAQLACLGVFSEHDRDGVLQDVHWYCGSIGYFPTYALGNFISAQLAAKLDRETPEWRTAVAAGNFAVPREKLAAELGRFGACLTPVELLKKLFGTTVPDGRVFLDYLRCKYAITK